MNNQISEESRIQIDEHLQAVEELLAVEQERIADAAGDFDEPPFPELPEALRWRLMVLACSLQDHLLWIRSHAGGHELTEIETGVSAIGADAADACRRYFAGETS